MAQAPTLEAAREQVTPTSIPLGGGLLGEHGPAHAILILNRATNCKAACFDGDTLEWNRN
jgi:hypothetical protein